MKGLPFVLAFTAMTFIAWGAYGPLLHHGTLSMGNDSLRAFVGVGIAYFFIAVLVPIYILRSQGEAGKWTISGTFYSLIAGSVGALGALGVILALAYGGAPIYVMPLVFGFAPIVNTLVTAWMSKTFDQISPVFIGGIVVAALGVAGVLAFKPLAPAHATHPTNDSKSDSHNNEKSSDKASSKDHTLIEPRDAVRFVSSLLIQEPVQDPLPPVVVQPAPPEPTNPTIPGSTTPEPAPAVPKPEPEAQEPQPTVPAQEQPAAPVQEPQELPPVVVQPAAPKDNEPVTPPTPEVAQAPAPEVPPAAVQPTPLPQTETKAPTVTPQETPKTNEPKPEPAKPEPAKPEVTKTEPESTKPEIKPEAAIESTNKKSAMKTAELLDEDPENKPQAAATKPAQASGKAPDVPMIVVSIIVAAICWGSYGPMLHQGQARMGGSRLRPFTCVGLAYFFIAVAAPLAVIYGRAADTGSWSAGGLSWSIIAGAAGAIGALGVILAFNAGGKPYYVMPLVFGFAPVINTCISLTEKGTWGLATPMFWISLGVVIAGAITVLLNAPKPKHAKPAT